MTSGLRFRRLWAGFGLWSSLGLHYDLTVAPCEDELVDAGRILGASPLITHDDDAFDDLLLLFYSPGRWHCGLGLYDSGTLGPTQHKLHCCRGTVTAGPG